MRYAVALLVLLTGCVSSHTTVTYSEDAGVAQDLAVDALLAEVRRTGARRVTNLTTIPGRNLVPAETARGTIRTFQGELLAQFSGSQYAGVRRELESALQQQSWEANLRVQQTPFGAGVERRSIEDVFASITDFVSALTRRPDKRVSFNVVSEPAEAAFRICPQYLDVQCYDLTTNGEVARLLRGYYTYTLQLAGYKPVRVDLDLVPFAKKRLKCILRRNEDPRAAGPCTPE